MDLSKVRVFEELLDVNAVNKYLEMGWKCVKIAMRCIPHSPVSGDCCHVYILGWTEETPPAYPFAADDDIFACF